MKKLLRVGEANRIKVLDIADMLYRDEGLTVQVHKDISSIYDYYIGNDMDCEFVESEDGEVIHVPLIMFNQIEYYKGCFCNSMNQEEEDELGLFEDQLVDCYYALDQKHELFLIRVFG